MSTIQTIKALLKVALIPLAPTPRMQALAREAQRQAALYYDIHHITGASREDVAALCFAGWTLDGLRRYAMAQGTLPELPLTTRAERDTMDVVPKSTRRGLANHSE